MLKTKQVVIVGIAVKTTDDKKYKMCYARDDEEQSYNSESYRFEGYKTYQFFLPIEYNVELGQVVQICYVNGRYESVQL